ncbi:MAG: alpha-mannosidase [Anaerolineae bacterium]
MDERIIRMKLDKIRARAVRRRWPIGNWQTRTAEHLAPSEYRYEGDWTATEPGSTFGAGRTLFWRARAERPRDALEGALYLEFDAESLEGLLSLNGRPYAGIDAFHSRVLLPADDVLALEGEFMCVGGSLSQPELGRQRAVLHNVSFCQVDADVTGAYHDIWFAWEASRNTHDERRRQLLHAALERALLAIDLTVDDNTFADALHGARKGLGADIAAIAPDPESGRVFLTGHSHIDTAWLWPLRETIRKCGRTFSTACRLMERYPDYHFSCSQPQLYAYTKEHYPQIYEEIKKWVATGRWECTGGMWVEPDCNVPSGESLVRQMLYGIEFFQREFGVRPRTCWLPDVFGYPASLPQILKGCGIDFFMTAKLHWQARNPFPTQLFWWQSLDGSRVLAHIPRLKAYYNGWPNPEQIQFAWDHFEEKGRYDEIILPFGYGDGGGGPTEEMLESAARAERYPGLPACRQGVEEDYFQTVVDTQPDLPLWDGELYLETHRGTYTSQAATKRANRKNELLLRDAEMLGVLANGLGAGLDLAPLRRAWESVLLLQFHDILPGSSIGEVYREALVEYAQVEATAREMRDVALHSLAARIAQPADLVAFNTLSWERSDVATAWIAAPEVPLELVQADGHVLPTQVIAQRDGEAEIVFVPASVPMLGYTTLQARPVSATQRTSLSVSERVLENRFFRLELNDEGLITRLFDKRHSRDVVPAGQAANRLQLFQDGPEREAAWNVHDTFDRREYDWDDGTTLQVLERGPVRASVRITRTYRQSRMVQDVVLYDKVARIDFVTQVDWQERQVMLKAAFAVDIRTTRATYEIQYGAVERPTHRNTSWDQAKFEVAGHRWADLSEAGYGVSLLNDCKYGYDTVGNVLRLTLLRGTEFPDPDADRGSHAFTYSLFPHAGDWQTGETVRRGWELNVPMLCAPAGTPGDSLTGAHSFVNVSGPALVDTIKPAENGQGWIVRLYEPNGARGPVQVSTSLPISQVEETNLVEESIGPVELAEQEPGVRLHPFGLVLKPFEVRTFRLS